MVSINAETYKMYVVVAMHGIDIKMRELREEMHSNDDEKLIKEYEYYDELNDEYAEVLASIVVEQRGN